MKKLLFIILAVPCIIFLLWYIPVSYYNVFACDDFWHGFNVKENGFLGAQSYYWNNWEGSYTHTFLATLPHIFDDEDVPLLCNIFTFILLYGSIYFFIHTFLKNAFHKNLIYSLYIISFLFTFTIGGAEIRFWVCANVTYLFGLSTLLLFISLYHKYNFDSRKNFLIGIGLLCLIFLIVGNKIQYIYALGIFVILHDCIYNKLSLRITGGCIFFIFLLSLMNILAPGNFERLALNMSESSEYSFSEVLFIRLTEIISYFKWCIFLFPISLLTRIEVKNKTLLFSSLAIAFIFLGDTIIMYVCFHDPGPIRSYIIIEATCILYTLIILNYLVNKFKKSTIANLGITILCSTIFSYIVFLNIGQIEPSIAYSQASKIRNKMIKEAPVYSNVIVEPLPNSGLLLSYFCNEDDWLQFVYCPYFNKDITIVINSNSQDNDDN